MSIVGVVAGSCLILWFGGASWAAWRLTGNWHYPVNIPSWRFVTAQEWLHQARQRVADGEFRRALGTINYGLTLAPNDPEMLTFKGNMQESLFRFQDALLTYQQVLRSNPDHWQARENAALCQRLCRFKEGAELRPATLYALHRVMLGQGRVNEAVAVSKRLETDRVLLQTTWQAKLDQSGLSGAVAVDGTGSMSLDLTGNLNPDLTIIRDFPLTSLNVANTGLDNVEALHGMALERLDLTGTVVHNLSPLRGMALRVLLIAGTGVVDLAELVDSPLRELDISRTRISDLSALSKVSLITLRADDTPVADLRPLAAAPLQELLLSRTKVSDLTPLMSLPLRTLALEGTTVFDLLPLKGASLQQLQLSRTGVSDLTPLAGMPLKVLTLSGCARVTDLRPLVTCTELEHLHTPPQPRFLDSLAKLPHLRFVERDGGKAPTLIAQMRYPSLGPDWPTR